MYSTVVLAESIAVTIEKSFCTKSKWPEIPRDRNYPDLATLPKAKLAGRKIKYHKNLMVSMQPVAIVLNYRWLSFTQSHAVPPQLVMWLLVPLARPTIKFRVTGDQVIAHAYLSLTVEPSYAMLLPHKTLLSSMWRM